jgi:hypothetical protein
VALVLGHWLSDLCADGACIDGDQQKLVLESRKIAGGRLDRGVREQYHCAVHHLSLIALR